ncbi:MAG: ABC transporter ATP-binding protein [Patescibacteria group bacterium]
MQTKTNQNPIVYLTKKLWKYSEGNRRAVALYFCMFLISASSSFLEPLIIVKVLNILQERGLTPTSMPEVMAYLSLFVVLIIVVWSLHGPGRVMERTNAYIVKANYKKYLLDGVMDLPLDWHADHHSGDTIDKIEKGTTALSNFTITYFIYIRALIKLVSSYGALVYFNVHSSYIVVLVIMFTIWLIFKFDKVLVAEYKQINKTENAIAQKVFDVISNITTIVILRVEGLVKSSVYKKIQEPLSLIHSNAKLDEIKWFLVSISKGIMIVAVMGSYLYMTYLHGGVLVVGTVFALYTYVDNIGSLFFDFAFRYGNIVQWYAQVQNSEELAQDFLAEKDTKRHIISSRWKNLTVENLRFSYAQGSNGEASLKNINLSISRGEKIAFIGASGSGKTTMLKVIRDLYKPQEGTYILDGKVVTGGFSSISDSIALIPQDPEIFSTTIRENITVGVPHSKAFIKKYTDLARFSDVVTRLPHGLESYIFEKGVNLSGGEKQRLALARGLMACEDKDIILLDEPTSSVDTKNEMLIYKNIFKAFKKQTIISSIHRLHLLSQFDTIYFFKEGKIIASGNLKQLLKNSKEFQGLWKKYHEISKYGEK